MGRRRKPIRRAVAAYLTLAAAGVFRLLPLSWSRVLARGLGRLAYYLVPRIRSVGFANLDLAYGDGLSRAEKRRILRASVDNVALVAAEFVHMTACARAGFAGQVRIAGLEKVDPQNGVLFVGGHLGNWEWMGPAFGSRGNKVAEVVRPLDHPRLNDFVDAFRGANHVRTIPKDAAGAEVLRLLRAGWTMGILIDQAPRENGVPVEFFGAPCWATAAPALVAARARVPIHLIAMIRQPDGRYVMEVHPPVPLVRTGDFTADLAENTQRCQAAFEAVVRAHPEQWLWFHRRWKKRGGLEREWAARMKKRQNRAPGQAEAGGAATDSKKEEPHV